MENYDDNLLDLPEIEINLDTDPDEPLWDKLIDQIIRGNVVPVLGADILIDNSTNLHQLLIASLANSFRLKQRPASFSELIYSREYRERYSNREVRLGNIYKLVNQVFAARRFEPSRQLKQLLSIRQFPFVITTSFTPVVEHAMCEIWGDELRVKVFSNNPSLNDDIKDATGLRKPTVYYMFGKVGGGAQTYALTDTDMLDFCASWLNDNQRPKNLCNELKDKYLLMLGNNYSDWLFRFIWYSMRKQNLGYGMLGYDELDESLINFLDRAEVFTKQNPTDVIDQIVSRLDKKLGENEQTKFNKPEENCDVFISYSRRDSNVAERLYRALSAQGKRVWYDRFNLTTGGRFMDEIRKAIRTAKYFVPILSHNITDEKDESHVYRNEWDVAIDVATSMGRNYLIPLAASGFDFYRAAIPEKMKQHNAVFFEPGQDIADVAEKLLHLMNQE